MELKAEKKAIKTVARQNTIIPLRPIRAETKAVNQLIDVEKAPSIEAQIKQLERTKKTLADQVLNLESKTSEINQLCVELVEAMGICEGLDELLSDLLDYLEFTNTPEIAFETELVKACNAIYLLRGQTENIRAKLESADPQTVEIGLQFEWLRAVNKHLSAIKTRLESEIKIFNVRE